jgi:hypothetical protein
VLLYLCFSTKTKPLTGKKPESEVCKSNNFKIMRI